MNPYQPGEDNQDPYEVGYKAGAASREDEIEDIKTDFDKKLAMQFRDIDFYKEKSTSRDAEVSNLAALGSSYFSRANAAEQERDQLREQVALARKALIETGERATCYRKNECVNGETRYGKGSYEDALNNAMGGTPWQICHCFPESYFRALAATEPK